MTAEFAEIALNLNGIINLLMHIFLRSNANRLAIRGSQTPWSEKRTMRVFGPSDLNIREHISYPVLWQPGDHENNPFIEKLEKCSIKSTETSNPDSFSTPGPMQHAVFPSPKADHPFTPPLKNPPTHRGTRKSSAYSIFPTFAPSRETYMSTSTTFSQSDDEYEMPLPPPPLFAGQHERSDSAQTRHSSATVQIGLRLSYLNHALDPLDASPSSILQLPLNSTESVSRDARKKRPDLPCVSGSSDAVNAQLALPAQSYGKLHRQFPSLNTPQAIAIPLPMSQLSPQAPPNQPETTKVAAAPILETLTSQAFQRPYKQAVVPSAAISRPQVGTKTQQKQATFPVLSIRPQIRIDTQQIAEDAAAVTSTRTAKSAEPLVAPSPGLPKAPKAAPSWRPQNWNTNKDSGGTHSSPGTTTRQEESCSRKGSGSDKGLPKLPQSAQFVESPLGQSNNRWNDSKPQVIQRPPGWV